MESHATGGTQCSEDGGEDGDEGLEHKLPELLLGTVLHFDGRYVLYDLRYRLLDDFVEDFLK